MTRDHKGIEAQGQAEADREDRILERRAEMEAATAQRTPGPWRLDGPHTREQSCGHKNCAEHPPQVTGYELRGADGLWLASIHGEHCKVPADDCHANARLIAAAPALLEALTKLTNIVECLAVNDAQVKMFDWDNVVSEARASLSAAKPSSLKGESSDGR